jgi:hypothetical protein
MLNLLIQAVFGRAQVALWEEGGKAVSLEWQSKRDELQKLLPKIELALKKMESEWSEIGKIVIVNGVGNFSATRISVTVANMLSLVSSARLYELKLESELPVEELLEMVRLKMQKGKVAGRKDNTGGAWPSVKLARPLYRHAPTITPPRRSVRRPAVIAKAGRQK